jgi:FHA domain/Bacterial regulatory proteins, luxR family
MSIELRDHGDPLAPHSMSATELKELLEAERVGRSLLAFRDPLGRLRLFVVPSAEKAGTVGRRQEMDLAIPWDHEVSGLHAELQSLGDELTIVDDGLSTNGTYVNGERINGRRRLRDGDRIRVGQTVLACRMAGAAIVFPTVAAVDAPERLQLTDTQRRVLIALCRPVRERDGCVTPATNRQIADEVFLSVDTVKMHLRGLFAKFALTELAQNQKRAQLATCALQLGVISPRETGRRPAE